MAWTFRILLENKDHEYSSFVTLTYRDTDLPEKLDISDIQKFLKRLRRSTPNPVRYFCVGEYGTKTARPHWHLILFGVPPLGPGLHHIKQWEFGHAHTGDVTPASVAYSARYSLKTGLKGGQYECLQSRRPGIGLRRLKEIGSNLAETTPRIRAMPHWFGVGKRKYPLDQYARLKVSEAYKAKGGLIEDESTNPAALEHEARITLITGDPFSPSGIGTQLITQDKRSFDYAKI